MLCTGDSEYEAYKKCRIKGLMCGLQCNHNRITHNWTMYEESIVPSHAY